MLVQNPEYLLIPSIDGQNMALNVKRKIKQLGGFRPRRCQQHCGRVRGPRVVPLQYVIPMLVTPIISEDEGSTINILEITGMDGKKETAFPFKCG